MEGFIGEIRLWAANFAPRDWAFCDGRSLPINEYQALFSILGTTYGGDGITTFRLPDLQGTTAVGVGARNGVQLDLGELTSLGGTGAGSLEGLALNYIICLNGIYPSRS